MFPPASNSRLQQQIDFLLEADRLKHTLRRTRLFTPTPGDSATPAAPGTFSENEPNSAPGAQPRRENSAEHSWHIALMAITLAEHANHPINPLRVLQMLLIHDLVEIDAGDTPAYGDQSAKAEAEQQAAHRIFSLLPADQHAAFLALWEEFEAQSTADAHFANALDRLLPSFQNLANQGGTWLEYQVDRPLVDRRLAPIAQGSTALWQLVDSIIDEGERRGYIAAAAKDDSTVR